MRRIFLCLLALVLLPRAVRAALLVDDGEGQGLSGSWYSYSDAYSQIDPKPFTLSPDGYRSAHCARLDTELKTGIQYPFAGFGKGFGTQDLSAYEGVRFYARGRGAWSCQVPTSATAVQNNHYSSPFPLTGDWTLVELPFSRFAQTWGNPQPWDPAQVTGVGFNFLGHPGDKGFLCVDDIEFYKKDEARTRPAPADVILKAPKVNQVGYRPGDPKDFRVAEVPGGARKGGAFRILDAAGRTAFSGVITGNAVDDTASTGEKVFRVDFSGLTLPGRYTVEVAGLKSPPFGISGDVYRPLFRDSLRCFYLIRCGTAVDDPETGIRHPACHLKDAALKEDPARRGDFTGGWHNADDYGKWVLEESLSCSWMMWLYELKTDGMKGFNDHIPESGNGVSDLLNQARWGLEWMLKMQEPDGSVRHKVDAEDHFCSGLSPDKDPYQRYAQKPGSLDAADFVGAMCQAARVYKDPDPAFAEKCGRAARRAWAWLEKHPDVVYHDPDYVDADPSQEKLWALGEMARLTGDPALAARFQREEAATPLQAPSWMAPQFFGYMALLFDPRAPEGEKDAIRKSLSALCRGLADASRANGYGVVTAPSEYYWECNENLLDKAGALLFGYAATGDKSFRDAALSQMDWLLGENGLSFSFVTGFGENSVRHPWHWTLTALGRLMPGWASGGPNQYPKGADPLLTALIKRGTPPAKCYVDACNGNGSWASNEGETSENAALVFCSGFLSAGR